MENKNEIQAQLLKLLNSNEFQNSKRMKELLTYLVDQTVSGKAKLLKGYTIAVDVFGRDKDFDTSNDAIVRVQAGKLRTKLEHYYLTEGISDPIRVSLPKGSYVPCFEQRKTSTPSSFKESSSQLIRDSASSVSLAVLPFHMLRKDDDNYLSAGLTEEISSLLTRYSDIKIVGKHALTRFDQGDESIQSLHNDYGVDFVLTGHILTSKESFRLNTQLIDVKTNVNVWAEKFDAHLTADSIFEVQDDIADKVLAQVALSYGAINRLHTRHALRKPPQELTHYEWVLRAYDYLDSPSAEKHLFVREGLDNTVAENPDYADAWIMLAWIYGDEYRFSYNVRNEASSLELAFEAATTATKLEPKNSKAFQQLAIVHYYRKELGKFEHAADMALALSPKDAYTLADLGTYYYLAGNKEKGLLLVNKAIDLNPLHSGWYYVVKFINAFCESKFDDALVMALKFRANNFYLFDFFLALTYAELGREAETEIALKDLLTAFPNFSEKVIEELDKNIMDKTIMNALLNSWNNLWTEFINS
jgi:adenylate cyclase